jgi:hypothetical protein
VAVRRLKVILDMPPAPREHLHLLLALDPYVVGPHHQRMALHLLRIEPGNVHGWISACLARVDSTSLPITILGLRSYVWVHPVRTKHT